LGWICGFGHEKEILRSKIFIDSFKHKVDGLSSGGRSGGNLAVGDLLAGAGCAAT